jgi:hypothetical protein
MHCVVIACFVQMCTKGLVKVKFLHSHWFLVFCLSVTNRGIVKPTAMCGFLYFSF